MAALTYGLGQFSGGNPPPTPLEKYQDPCFLVQPWYWVPADEVNARLGDWKRGWLMGFRRITSSSNERTGIFSFLPRNAAADPCMVLFNKALKTFTCVFFSGFNSLPFDYFVRQKLGGTDLRNHYFKQFPVLPPEAYTEEDLGFIVPRVLELVYTAWDVKPFADDVWQDADDALKDALRAQHDAHRRATGGHPWRLPDWIDAYPEIETDPAKGIPLPPFRWDEERRAVLMAELDAWFARLYGLTRKQLRYILDPADLTPKELADLLDPWEEVADPLDEAAYRARAAASDFPGETFRVLKDKENRTYGAYRTRRLVLEAWARVVAAPPAAVASPPTPE